MVEYVVCSRACQWRSREDGRVLEREALGRG
jgi:hypothetical protein